MGELNRQGIKKDDERQTLTNVRHILIQMIMKRRDMCKFERMQLQQFKAGNKVQALH